MAIKIDYDEDRITRITLAAKKLSLSDLTIQQLITTKFTSLKDLKCAVADVICKKTEAPLPEAPLNNDEFVGYAGGLILDELTEVHNLKPKSTKIAVYGFEKISHNFCEYAIKKGFKIVAISDSKSAVRLDNGINIAKLHEYKKEKRTLEGFEGSTSITNEELLELNVDILVPTESKGIITNKNANNIRAKFIIELADSPVTLEADKILVQKNILLIPDILANSDEIIDSYLEWYKNTYKEDFDKDLFMKKIFEKISKAFYKVFEVKEKYDTDMRTSAYIVAINRPLGR